MMNAVASGATALILARRALSGTHTPPSRSDVQAMVPASELSPSTTTRRNAGRVSRGPTAPRQQRAHHCEVIDRARACRDYERRRIGLAKDVGSILSTESRVDWHQHGADAHDRKRGVDPLGAVGHPERDLVACSNA